jgi:hypothetical protein
MRVLVTAPIAHARLLEVATLLGGDSALSLALYALIVAVLAFLFGDGVLRLVVNLIARRYKWEPAPFIDSNSQFKAGMSHDYATNRVITHALVAMQPSLLLSAVSLLVHRRRLPRRIEVLQLVDSPEQSIDIEPGKPYTWTKAVHSSQSLPGWKHLGEFGPRDLSKVRLKCVVQVGRRSAKVKRVTRPRRGVLDPTKLKASKPVKAAPKKRRRGSGH